MKKWRWTPRNRTLLTFEAIVLPAAALIAYNLWNLHSIQRDRSVEAAIQRDFTQVLKIAEKRMTSRMQKMIAPIRADFPCPEDSIAEKLDELLTLRPELAHLFVYDEKAGYVFRSRADRMHDPDFRKEAEELSKNLEWVKMESKDMVEKLRKAEEKEGLPVAFSSNNPSREGTPIYQNIVFFTLPNAEPKRVALGGIIFDADYLRDSFIPAVLNGILEEELPDAGPRKAAGNDTAIMVHLRKETEPFAASEGWPGGMAEVERITSEGAMPNIVLGIKFRGTTIEALSRRFIRNSLLIVGGLSLLLAGGIWLTYRNVNREMALAKLKSDFVANVSHELRTPLSLIRLYAETLEMGRLTSAEKYQEYFRIIRKESERLTGLINNILDFSRIEAGKKEYDFRETNLAELVRTTLESYRFQIEQQGFAFEEHIAEDVPTVRVDREAIARSLLNLVNNALKYSPKDKFLAVNLYRSNGSVKLEVVDRGMGIPRSEQPKIFEKFYRVGDPLVHNTKGSGLGLSLVRHIVQAHGGEVSVESSPGKGSTFTIALPLEPPAPSQEAA